MLNYSWLTLALLPTNYTSSATFTSIGAPQSAILREGLLRLGLDPASYASYRLLLDLVSALIDLVIAALLIRRKSSKGVVLLIALLLVAGIAALDPPSLLALAATNPFLATILARLGCSDQASARRYSPRLTRIKLSLYNYRGRYGRDIASPGFTPFSPRRAEICYYVHIPET